MDKIQSHAKLAIIGGGIMGVSLLYHLTKEGWTDIVLIEKSEAYVGINMACGRTMSSYVE